MCKVLPITHVAEFYGLNWDAWIELAERYCVLVLAPEFPSEAFPRARGYNLGGMKGFLGVARDPEEWAFSVIDPVFRAV